jgi:hypothetical protein
MIFSVGLGATYLFYGLLTSIKKSNLVEIEKKIPNLEWQLRTAADNMEKDNEIISNLNKEVSEKIGFVSFLDLLSGRRTIIRIFCILIFSSLAFYTYSADINLITSATGSGLVGKITDSLFDESVNAGILDNFEKNGENLADMEADLSVEKDVVEKEIVGEKFGGGVGNEQDSSFYEDISYEEESIIRNFYNNLNK